jgi:hypothetical protein
MLDSRSRWIEQDNRFADNDDSSWKHGDRSVCEYVPPKDGPFGGNKADDDNVSQVMMLNFLYDNQQYCNSYIVVFKSCRWPSVLIMRRAILTNRTRKTLVRYVEFNFYMTSNECNDEMIIKYGFVFNCSANSRP